MTSDSLHQCPPGSSVFVTSPSPPPCLYGKDLFGGGILLVSWFTMLVRRYPAYINFNSFQQPVPRQSNHFPLSLLLSVFFFLSSALLVLLQDSLLATASSPKFSELVMKVKFVSLKIAIFC